MNNNHTPAAQASGTNAEHEERMQRISTRFANRPRTPATADFDLPAPNDERAAAPVSGDDQQYLAMRLKRVARAAGVEVLAKWSDAQVAECAVTILGEIARKLELAAPVEQGQGAAIQRAFDLGQEYARRVDNDDPTAADVYRTLAALKEQQGAGVVPAGWRDRLTEMRDAAYTVSQYPETAQVVFDSVIDALDELEAAAPVPAVATADKVRDAWISVDERLPEDCQDVLVLCPDTGCEPSIWSAQWLAGSKTFESNSNGWADLDDISHWMPRPATPTNGKASDGSAA
jgi:hypothetical protein